MWRQSRRQQQRQDEFYYDQIEHHHHQQQHSHEQPRQQQQDDLYFNQMEELPQHEQRQQRQRQHHSIMYCSDQLNNRTQQVQMRHNNYVLEPQPVFQEIIIQPQNQLRHTYASNRCMQQSIPEPVVVRIVEQDPSHNTFIYRQNINTLVLRSIAMTKHYNSQ